MAKLFDAGVPVIGANPNPGNLRAMAVYKKLGFRVAGSELHTKGGTILPMEARLLYNGTYVRFTPWAVSASDRLWHFLRTRLPA